MHAYGAQPDQPTLYYKGEGNKKRRPNPGSESVHIVPKFGGPATGTISWGDGPLGVLRVTGTFTPKQPLEAVKYALVTRPSVHAEESSGPNPSGEPVTFSGRVTFEDEVIITCSSGEQVDLVKLIEELQEQVKRCSQQRSEKADLAEWLEHQSREETISPGDVVYCRDGKITKRRSDLPGTMCKLVEVPTCPGRLEDDEMPLVKRKLNATEDAVHSLTQQCQSQKQCIEKLHETTQKCERLEHRVNELERDNTGVELCAPLFTVFSHQSLLAQALSPPCESTHLLCACVTTVMRDILLSRNLPETPHVE